MAITNTIFDLADLYQRVYGSRPYVIDNETPTVSNGQPYQISGSKMPQLSRIGSVLKEQYMGVEIWLPAMFWDLPESYFKDIEDCEIVDVNKRRLYLPYVVIRVTGRKEIIKTPVNARGGTVKEAYNIDDYNITMRGFLIDKVNYQFPELQIIALKRLFELNQSVAFDNGLTNIFLNSKTNVAIETLDFPEVEGGKWHVRPFSMQMVSDNISSLIWTPNTTLSNNNTIVNLN